MKPGFELINKLLNIWIEFKISSLISIKRKQLKNTSLTNVDLEPKLHVTRIYFSSSGRKIRAGINKNYRWCKNLSVVNK